MFRAASRPMNAIVLLGLLTLSVYHGQRKSVKIKIGELLIKKCTIYTNHGLRHPSVNSAVVSIRQKGAQSLREIADRYGLIPVMTVEKP